MEELLEEIRTAVSAAEIETVSAKINAVYASSTELDKMLIRSAAADLGKKLGKQAEITINEARKILDINKEKYDLAEWVTIREYARRFGIASTNVITNWIRRGIVPKENVIEIDELNSLRLIKAVPYV